ncbi:uncharacterized protein LACBIDRAFT_329478 [Laccaria bicolor S238N-H82]|uniref:Predicted protein n=1 Tax=Laccaria bicolor (strain S238N-H82 / ATCC MYA-4686) TaxID=486041 RepID=B0DI51_LACBS|nr:uncharacterized protein LACBIDRAFT_329478 [Laccaria bicolor S238N-H82]EDR05514.1 predicted protein [Laccaria bicolor S238N-H82]|eukprot:XP_001883618.1 predicted protein [Laccaria bicolor S238N-H82]
MSIFTPLSSLTLPLSSSFVQPFFDTRRNATLDCNQWVKAGDEWEVQKVGIAFPATGAVLQKRGAQESESLVDGLAKQCQTMTCSPTLCIPPDLKMMYRLQQNGPTSPSCFQIHSTSPWRLDDVLSSAKRPLDAWVVSGCRMGWVTVENFEKRRKEAVPALRCVDATYRVLPITIQARCGLPEARLSFSVDVVSCKRLRVVIFSSLGDRVTVPSSFDRLPRVAISLPCLQGSPRHIDVCQTPSAHSFRFKHVGTPGTCPILRHISNCAPTASNATLKNIRFHMLSTPIHLSKAQEDEMMSDKRVEGVVDVVQTPRSFRMPAPTNDLRNDIPVSDVASMRRRWTRDDDDDAQKDEGRRTASRRCLMFNLRHVDENRQRADIRLTWLIVCTISALTKASTHTGSPPSGPSECRAVSPVFLAFPWATPHIVQVPKPLADFTEIMSPHKHFINSLNRFERSLFAFDELVVNSNELAPLLGLDVLKASNTVTLHPTATTASSKGEYKTLASILCAYRTFEVLALDCETGVSHPPSRLLPPLAFNKSEQDSGKIVVHRFIYILILKLIFLACMGFDRLENWPKALLNFRKLIGQSGLPQIPDDLLAGSKHLALLRMASKNKEKAGYMNVVDNFLQAALHLYYLKMTQFRDGSLPDYPDILNDHLCIFKDKTSTDEFINDQEEGTYYLQDLLDGETASHTLHQLGTPLQLALLLTPFYLLFPFWIITRSYNRRLVLEAFAELTPRKTPLVLKIERSIWCSLIALADVTITPHEALTQLVSRLPWAEIEAASNNPHDCCMFCTPLAQPSSSSTPLQPGLAVGRQLAIEGASNTLTPDIQVSGPMPEASVIPNTQRSTSIEDNASCINEEHLEAPMDHDGDSPMLPTPLPTSKCPELPSMPAPTMDQDGGSPMLPTPLPTSKRPELPSMPAPTMDQDGGSPMLPTPLPTSKRPESSSTPDPDGDSPMPESLETSLASVLNSVFQSCPISSPHLGTVNPSHISLPLNVLGKNLSGEEDIEMGALSELSSSSEDEDSEHSPARPAKKTNPEVQPSDNDNTDDEESSLSSSDESTDSGVKKPIGNTSGNRGGRGDPGNLKKLVWTNAECHIWKFTRDPESVFKCCHQQFFFEKATLGTQEAMTHEHFPIA